MQKLVSIKSEQLTRTFEVLVYIGLAIIGAAMANKGRFKDMKVLSEEGWHAMHDKVTKQKMFGYEFLLSKLFIILFFSFFAV